MPTKDFQSAIVGELERQAAFSPEDAIEPHAMRQSLGILMTPFDAAVSDLTDRGMVGSVMGALYLKQ
ncbi:hypothetical protein RA2_04004 [Roseovarius sp. A-2]|uniref:hypothetical protein n=1 Tax=Roseovarius sp. A-2 TaxID=1570360 RepID=UPI0009B50BCD|nr:hypothetical protein [Roseovarius sp. A-2]GAW36929.1 hypothetical protein RA2_04004 [Roseovarius sp. A-2]